jgi:hypothetical protein
MPLISHKDLVQYLARKTTSIQSLEQIIVSHQGSFANFNARFYDSLPSTLNAIQFLAEIGMIDILDGELIVTEKIDYVKPMGKRAEKIFNASKNIAQIIKTDTVSLYTNLRIQL